MSADLGYTQSFEHKEHPRPSLKEAASNGAYLVARSSGGLAIRYACPEPDCEVLLEDPIQSTNPGFMTEYFRARGLPIQEERYSDPHLELGLPSE